MPNTTYDKSSLCHRYLSEAHVFWRLLVQKTTKKGFFFYCIGYLIFRVYFNVQLWNRKVQLNSVISGFHWRKNNVNICYIFILIQLFKKKLSMWHTPMTTCDIEFRSNNEFETKCPSFQSRSAYKLSTYFQLTPSIET